MALLFITVWNISYSKKSDKVLEEWETNIKSIISVDPQQAIVLSDSLLKIGNDIDDDQYISVAYYLQGIANYYIGRNYLSNELYKKALNTSYGQTDLEFQGKCWNNMGINLDIMDKNAEAISIYHKSLKVSEQLKDSLGIAQSWINIGLLDTKMANYERSQILLEKALKYFTRKKDTLNMGLCYQNIGIIYQNLGMQDSSIYFFKKSYDSFETIDYKYGMSQNSYNLSMRYTDKNEFKIAENYLFNSLRLAQEINATSQIANIYLHLAILNSKDYKKRMHYTKLAQELYEEIGDKENSLNTYLWLCEMFAHSGDIANFDKYFKIYKEKTQSVSYKNSIERYEEFQAIYDSEEKQNIILEQNRKLERRNVLLIFSGLIILILITFAGIVSLLMLKMRKYIRALYKKNVDLRNANIISITPEQIKIEEDALVKEVSAEQIPEEKKSSEVVSSKMTELYQEIIHLFESEKLYLKHDLSVSELSAKLNTNDKYISVAINNNSQSNFNNLVNAFRINEAKILIAQFGKTLNIKELADRSGYKSLNTFYKNFKEITGLTPSQYIELSEDKELN